MTEQVNHPQHYNWRKDGIECIDIIRHYVYDIGAAIKYLWRAGKKQSQGKSERDKEIDTNTGTGPLFAYLVATMTNW